MKYIITVFLTCFLVLSAATVSAEIQMVPNLNIERMFSDNSGNVYLLLSDGKVAFINQGEKELYSLTLASFMAGKTVTIHRFTPNEGKYHIGSGLVDSYRLHRIDVIK